jgi:hypothetical protein
MGIETREAAMGPEKRLSLEEAARTVDATVEELVTAIKDGLLHARVLQGTGEYAIDPEDLARWVKRTRHADTLKQLRQKKVLLLGEDSAFAAILKLELARNDRIDVRYATWGADAIMMINHYKADLYVVDLSPSKVAPDEVLAAVADQRTGGGGRILATCAQPQQALEAHPLIRARVESLAPDGFIPRAGSMRPLLVAIFGTLGLQTNTRVIKLQT